jgi:hypothetical protein
MICQLRPFSVGLDSQNHPIDLIIEPELTASEETHGTARERGGDCPSGHGLLTARYGIAGFLDRLMAPPIAGVETPIESGPWRGFAVFRLPTILHSLATANSMLVRRDNPLQMTLLPGGPSLALARYPPSLAILIR